MYKILAPVVGGKFLQRAQLQASFYESVFKFPVKPVQYESREQLLECAERAHHVPPERSCVKGIVLDELLWEKKFFSRINPCVENIFSHITFLPCFFVRGNTTPRRTYAVLLQDEDFEWFRNDYFMYFNPSISGFYLGPAVVHSHLMLQLKQLSVWREMPMYHFSTLTHLGRALASIKNEYMIVVPTQKQLLIQQKNNALFSPIFSRCRNFAIAKTA